MRKLTLLLGLIAGTLGALCIVQWHKLAEQRVQSAALKGKAEMQTEQIANLEAAKEKAERQRRQLLEQTDELARQLQVTTEAASNPAVAAPGSPAPAVPPVDKGNKTGFGSMLAKMMEDPATKKFIRDQQRGMLDQIYGPLVRQLGLTPEEASTFKDLLADNMLKTTEKASSLLDASSSTNRAALAETMGTEQKSFDEQLKGFLGEARYAQYKDYQETVGERTQLTLYKQQTGIDLGLTAEQTDQLLGFMKEEKKGVAAMGGQPLTDGGQKQSGLQALLSEDQTEKLLQSQETVNQRVYERAQAVLSPEQLDAFAKFQTNQLQTMRVSMSLARKLLTPESSENGTGQANQ